MKKRIRRILCVMMVAVSLLTVSAFAARGTFTFNVSDHTEYDVAGSATKDNTSGSATITPSSGSNYTQGVVFRIKESRTGDDYCTSTVTRYNLGQFSIKYSSGKNTEGTKYLCARRATAASGDDNSIYMTGTWQP